MILEKVLKTTKCYTDIRSFIGNKIVSCLFQIALQYDKLLEDGKPCFSFFLGPAAGAQHPLGAPRVLTEVFICICLLCEIREGTINLAALCIINVAEIDISAECQRSIPAACLLESARKER